MIEADSAGPLGHTKAVSVITHAWYFSAKYCFLASLSLSLSLSYFSFSFMSINLRGEVFPEPAFPGSSRVAGYGTLVFIFPPVAGRGCSSPSPVAVSASNMP